MSWRTVIISEHARLDVQSGFMLVRTGDGLKKVVLDELDVLLVENSATSISVNLLARLAEKNVRVIFCDPKRNPFGELEPYANAHDTMRKLRTQLAWTEEAKAAVWQRIVGEKISNQAKTLSFAGNNLAAEALRAEAARIRPYDETNVEGMSARFYFSQLFGTKFRRGDSSQTNAALDYGYALILSAVNRVLAAHGYLALLGIFHHNVFNRWNLSCDLMEPYRPYIDRRVLELLGTPFEQFGKDQKRHLVRSLHEEMAIGTERRTVISGMDVYVSSVVAALTENNATKIVFPEY